MFCYYVFVRYETSHPQQENDMTFAEELRDLNACREAVVWASDLDLATAWNECQRSDWMHWLLERVQVAQNTSTLIACDHAESVAHLAGDHESLCRETIAIARGVAAGTHTRDQSRAAWDAERAAWAARAAAWAAKDAERAAWAAWDAARAARAAGAAEDDQANTLRKHIPAAEVVRLWEARE